MLKNTRKRAEGKTSHSESLVAFPSPAKCGQRWYHCQKCNASVILTKTAEDQESIGEHVAMTNHHEFIKGWGAGNVVLCVG